MPVPSYRVPVRVARGTLAALTAGLADLQEGEICYATDGNALYVVEGGVLTVAGSAASGDLVDDTTPQLGGPLDVNGNEIVSLANANVLVAPDGTGVLELRGNTGNDAAIQLNCETNGHGVKIQSPPHSAAATYTLILPDDTGTTGQALTTDGTGALSWTTSSVVGSIDDLSDVDTTTTAPTDGQALIWDNANSEWVPGGVVADISSTSIDALSDVDTTTAAPTTNQVLAWDGTSWAPADASVGGGGGGSATARLSESATAASGAITFTDIGHSGTLVSVTSSLDAWIVLYGSAADRTSDAGRAYNTDPSSGSGVLAEFYITAGNTVLATPGTSYFNNDTSSTEAVYAAVRDQSSVDVNSAVDIVAYGNQAITSVSGGTFGSGL